MAKKQKTKAFSFKGFDNKHYRLTDQYVAAVDALFTRATKEISIAATKGTYSPDKPFSFEDYPKTKVQVQKIINGLASNITAVMETGSRKQWLYACQKNDEFVASIMDTSKLSKAWLSKMQDRNLDALQTFQQRKVNGMNLSQRVWKYVGQYKDQIELGLDVGLGEGRSAQQLSKDLRQNLQDPDRLFRRVRDKRGNLVLSKAAKAFHPGVGVYRSSAKNATRLTRSEINMAYRESDWLRWQQLDFVVGFEIHRSKHEPLFKCNLCQRLVGRYPKTFKFKGWHPQCMCYATAILMDENDFDAQELSDLKSALYGKEYKKLVPKNTVTDFPQGFKDWVTENQARQMEWASTPYFIRDNFVNGNLVDGLKYIAPTKPIKPVKTEQQKADIQANWNTRVTSRKYNGQLQEIEAKYTKESDAIAKLIGKINNEIQRGTTISKVDSMMNELNHKLQVKAAWDERMEINNLETLLVGVKALKTKFDMPTIQSVFNAVETKLATWENLPFEQQVKKLNFEIEWVEKNKKYDTWQVAQAAYKKRLVKVEYLIDKQSIQTSITHAFDFTQTTKSVKVKQLAMELNTLFDNNAPIAQLKQKALLLSNEVAKLEAAKAARDTKKLFGDMQSVDWDDESNYTKNRKDAAMWAKTAKEADEKVRSVLETIWQGSNAHEKLSAYRYTAGSSYINEHLRGQYYSGQYLGKYNSKKDADALTSIVNKSSYKFDMWVQRGVDANGFKGLFGSDIENISINNLKSIYGKTGIEKAFSSCGLAKGTGFDSKKIIYNIYCPRGTKMLYAEPYSAFGNGSGKTWDGKAKQQYFGGEAEMILQRSTKFRIIKAEYSEGRYYIDLEVIGQ
jgi:hypothetical protein